MAERPRASKRITQTKQNRERIIQGAARLMIDRGIANTSLADIAAEVGMSKGTIFYHYRSKADLIFDISERHISRITEKIHSWVDRTQGSRSLGVVLRLIYDTILSNERKGQIHLYLIQEALAGSERLRERYREEYDRWKHLLVTGLSQLPDAPNDAVALAMIILYSIDGLLMHQVLGVQDLGVSRISRYLGRDSSADRA